MPADDGLVLVTGASGFVGSHLAEALVARGYKVRCLVRRSSDLAFVRDLPVELAYADLRDGDGLRRTCAGVGAVCHCAGLTRAVDEKTFMAVNAHATLALSKACLAESPALRRFVFVSSQAAAGPSSSASDVLDESREPHPVTWYGTSKLAAERALQSLAQPSRADQSSRPLPLTIVRPASVFGPRDRDFLTYFGLVRHGLRLRVGDQERRLSLIYVRDLVRLIVLALESNAALGQTYFASSMSPPLANFSKAIGRVLGKRTVSVWVPEVLLAPMAWWSGLQARLTGRPALINSQRVKDIRHHFWLCSAEKARRELGFAPEYDLDAAVRETAAWYSDCGWL